MIASPVNFKVTLSEMDQDKMFQTRMIATFYWGLALGGILSIGSSNLDACQCSKPVDSSINSPTTTFTASATAISMPPIRLVNRSIDQLLPQQQLVLYGKDIVEYRATTMPSKSTPGCVDEASPSKNREFQSSKSNDGINQNRAIRSTASDLSQSDKADSAETSAPPIHRPFQIATYRRPAVVSRDRSPRTLTSHDMGEVEPINLHATIDLIKNQPARLELQPHVDGKSKQMDPSDNRSTQFVAFLVFFGMVVGCLKLMHSGRKRRKNRSKWFIKHGCSDDPYKYSRSYYTRSTCGW